MEFPIILENGLVIRLPEPRDSKDFAKWATENGKIPKKDILSVFKANNPTSTALVVEQDGKVIMYVPFYCVMNIGFLGFNPEASSRDRIKAMGAMLSVLAEFAKTYGVNELTVQSAKDYPVAQWAVKHGFEPESRQTFKYHVKPVEDPSEVKEPEHAV